MASRILQQLLDAHYPAFAETHPLADHVRDAVQSLRSCRTAALAFMTWGVAPTDEKREGER